MTTQISRDSFAPEQRYSGLYLQQGRMILDADWNELSDLQKSRLAEALRDAIASGAPRSGGLALVADAGDSGKVKVQPGVLYVDGVPARFPGSALTALTAQPDYPWAGPYPGKKLVLYADVWDRPVTALERPELMDPALHGADTATRSQTLLQVKWCANTLDPLDPAVNPPMGNGLATLTLRKIDSGSDPCNPCAAQVAVNDRLGNYLFRVEVHDVDPAAKTVTLKWSRDNGAEACASATPPPGFDQGDWVWEYFDADTERLLGLHLGGTTPKLRGLIREAWNVPTGANEPQAFARQWDGYGIFRTDTGALVKGRDRGVTLATAMADDPAHGSCWVAGNDLLVNLENLALRLSVKGRQFVPGDHWLATIREAVQASGDVVLNQAPPHGVRHHFLRLGTLLDDGSLQPPTDAERRRLAFPPLSDLHAADVGFTEQCNPLFHGAQNVQQALDALCNLGAQNVHYTPPACAVEPSVRSLLGLANSPSTVDVVLDALLCGLRANDVPLDKSDAALCSDLRSEAVVTVQDALKALCLHSGGCEVVVRDSDQLMKRLKQAAEDKKGSLWLKLCAGSYEIPEDLSLSGLTSLRLSGESAAASQIIVGAQRLRWQAGEIVLEDLGWTFKQPAAQLGLQGATVTVRDCTGLRQAEETGGPALVQVAAPEGQPATLHWQASDWTAWVAPDLKFRWQPEGGGAADKDFLKALQKHVENLLQHAPAEALDKSLAQLMAAWKALGAERWRAWSAAVPKAPLLARLRYLAQGQPQVVRLSQLPQFLGSGGTASTEQIQAALDGLARLVAAGQPDQVLALADTQVGGSIRHSRLQGWLLMLNGLKEGSPTTPPTLHSVQVHPVVVPGGATLQIADVSLSGVRSALPPKAVDGSSGTLQSSLPGLGRLLLDQSRFELPGSVFTAGSWIGQGNTWDFDAFDNLRPGMALCDRATFTGNVLEGYTDNTNIPCTADGGMQSGLNVLIELRPPQ